MRVEELAPEGCAAESSGAATESPVWLALGYAGRGAGVQIEFRTSGAVFHWRKRDIRWLLLEGGHVRQRSGFYRGHAMFARMKFSEILRADLNCGRGGVAVAWS